jgi:hypothetical protein
MEKGGKKKQLGGIIVGTIEIKDTFGPVLSVCYDSYLMPIYSPNQQLNGS